MTRQEASTAARTAHVEGARRDKDEDDENVTYDSRGGERKYLGGYRGVEGFAKANDGGVTSRVGTDE